MRTSRRIADVLFALAAFAPVRLLAAQTQVRLIAAPATNTLVAAERVLAQNGFYTVARTNTTLRTNPIDLTSMFTDDWMASRFDCGTSGGGSPVAAMGPIRVSATIRAGETDGARSELELRATIVPSAADRDSTSLGPSARVKRDGECAIRPVLANALFDEIAAAVGARRGGAI